MSPSVAQPRDAKPIVYSLSVPATGVRPAYRANAWVLRFRSDYLAEMFALGNRIGATSALKSARNLSELVRANRGSLVFNGGFSEDYSTQAAGLLIVSRRVLNPISLKRASNGEYALSGILCQSSTNKLTVLRTADFAERAQSILSLCRSSLQAGPLVVENGLNGVGFGELASREPQLRTIVGVDGDGRTLLIVFTTPVHLHAAGAFLSAAKGSAGATTVVLRDTGGSLAASHGLGVVSALNLDGSTNSCVIFAGLVIAGTASRSMPSAIVVR